MEGGTEKPRKLKWPTGAGTLSLHCCRGGGGGGRLYLFDPARAFGSRFGVG